MKFLYISILFISSILITASPVDELEPFFNTKLFFTQSSLNKLSKTYEVSKGTFIRNSDSSVRIDINSPFKEIYFLSIDGLEIHDLDFDQIKKIPISEINNFLVSFIINGDINSSQIINLKNKSFSIIENEKKFDFEFINQNTLHVTFQDNMEVDNLIKFTKDNAN